MDILSQKLDGANVVEVQVSRIDAACALEFKNRVLALVDEGTKSLILDLKHVNYIDSSGLGAIVGVFKMLGQQSAFCIVGLTQAVARMFELTRMDRVFNIHASLDQAM